MKNKVLAFIIGLLVGAIITTTGFIIYQKNNKKEPGNGPQMTQGTNNMENSQSSPPEKPTGENNTQSEKPPEKPANETNNISQNSSNIIM